MTVPAHWQAIQIFRAFKCKEPTVSRLCTVLPVRRLSQRELGRGTKPEATDPLEPSNLDSRSKPEREKGQWSSEMVTCRTYELKRADSFLRSQQLFGHSRNSQNFMENKGPLSCSQHPDTGLHPPSDESSPQLTGFFQIHFYIIIPSTSMSSQRTLSFKFSYQKFVCRSVLYMLYALPTSSSLMNSF